MDEIYNFMRAPAISIEAQSSVQKAAEILSEKKISSLLIRENDDYVGIVTTTDIIREVVAKGFDPKTTLTHSIMSKPLITMNHYLTRSDANELMLRKKIKHLGVTKDGKVTGILTTKDMIS